MTETEQDDVSEISAESEEALNEAKSLLLRDLQAPERITIEVLKQLVRESPHKMAYAASRSVKTSFERLAALLLLLGEDSARIIVAELGEHEKALLASCVAALPPVSLEEQCTILKEFTESALRANSSLFGNPDFAKNIAAPLPQPTAFEKSETGE